MVAAWEERLQGRGRTAPDAAVPAGVAVLDAHGRRAERSASDGMSLRANLALRPSGRASPANDRLALRQLLDGVEAEHARQLRGLREQLGLAREQLSQALHGAGQERPAGAADGAASAPITPRTPNASEATLVEASFKAPSALAGMPGAPLGCPPVLDQPGEGCGGGGACALGSDLARAGAEGQEKVDSFDEPLRGAALMTSPGLPQGRRWSLQVPPDNPATISHESPASKDSNDEEETRRQEENREEPRRISRKKTEKNQIIWDRPNRGSKEKIAHSMFMRLLNTLGIDRILAGQQFRKLTMEKSKMNAVGVFINSPLVNHICCAVIVLNAMCIGASAHFAIQAQINQESVSSTWEDFEVVFTVWFTAELLLRVVGERELFYLGDDRGWNFMDLFLVVSSLTTLLTTASTPSLTSMRVMRIFRLIRIFRAVRVIRSIQNFRIMILAIIQSFGTLMWVSVVIISFQFIFAVLFMHGAADYLKEEGLHSDDAQAIKDTFGDIFTAMLTLFEAITGGRDWHEVIVALLDMHWAYGLLFLVYIFFMTFLVLNVVVGGVVKTTSEVYKRDKNLIVQEEQQKVHLYSDEVKTFFREADSDGSGTLSWDEFRQHLKDEKVKAYFTSLDLEISQAHMLFSLLDADGDDEVGIDEFIDGCMTLKGAARTIDIKYLTQQVQSGLDCMTRMVNDEFDRLVGVDTPLRMISNKAARRASVSVPLGQRSDSIP